MYCGENASLQVLLNHEKNLFFCESMANGTEDTTQPAENKCDEADEPSSPTGKGKQVTTKITLCFQAAGNAPGLKNRKFAVEATRKVADVSSFLRRLMKLSPAENLFLYINQAFSPGLDQTIGNLFECFGAEGVLNIQYCTSQAWG